MHWKRKRSSGCNQRPQKHKSHRNGGFCALVSGWRWFYFQCSENEKVVCHKSVWCSRNGTALLIGDALPNILIVTVSITYSFQHIGRQVFGTRTSEQQISRMRRSRLREDGSGRDDALRGLACEGLRWRRRAGDDFHSSRLRCGRIQTDRPIPWPAMLGKIYIKDPLLYGSIRIIYTEMFLSRYRFS
jgi:hypothetical protein